MTRLLIAGIGNIFQGDDAFGVEVIHRLAARPLPEGVRLLDAGIRGFDLACALVAGFAGVILVDATCRGGAPGTIYLLEVDSLPKEGAACLDPHGLHPAAVLHLARSLGEVCPWIRLVGCEPLTLGTVEEPIMGLSAPVSQAVDEAVRLVEELAGKWLDGSLA